MKGKSSKSILCLVLAMILIVGILTGCTGSGKDTSNATSSQTEAASKAEESQAPAENSTAEPVVTEPVKLTFWTAMDSKVANSCTSYEDLLCMQKLEEILNVDVEWQHPPIGEEAEQFNLMVASTKLPDMIFYDWINGYSGGPEKAMADGVIMPFNDYMDLAPNLEGWFEKIPALKKQSATDSGALYMFPSAKEICMYEETMIKNIWMGPIYRADWVKALNIEEPRTVDQVHDMLVAFKENYDCIPYAARGLSGGSSGLFCMASAYGCLADFYVDGDAINYGLLNPAFKTYVQTMAQWFAEGLIDPDFMATDKDSLKAKVTNGEVGMLYGTGSGNWKSFVSIMETTVPEADLEIMHFPTGPDGKAYTSQWDVNLIVPGVGSAITTKCSNVEACMQYLDYGYSEEGILLENIGVEGITFEYDASGVMQYTADFMAKVAEKDLSTVNGQYVMPGSSWSTIDPLIKNELNDRTFPDQDPLSDIWGDNVSCDLILPPLTATAEEATQLSNIMNQVKTYRDEMISKIIMGQVSFDEYDSVVEQCKNMGLEDALAIENAAYERYKNR